MPEYKVLKPFQKNKKEYQPGDVVDIATSDANPLVQTGVLAEPLPDSEKETAEEPKKKKGSKKEKTEDETTEE